MTIEKLQENTPTNNINQISVTRQENIEFLTLDEKMASGLKLTETEQDRFKELKKIREARYLVNQESEPFTHEGKQRLTK